MRSEGTERRTTYTIRPKRDVQRKDESRNVECQNARKGNMEFDRYLRNSTMRGERDPNKRAAILSGAAQNSESTRPKSATGRSSGFLPPLSPHPSYRLRRTIPSSATHIVPIDATLRIGGIMLPSNGAAVILPFEVIFRFPSHPFDFLSLQTVPVFAHFDSMPSVSPIAPRYSVSHTSLINGIGHHGSRD